MKLQILNNGLIAYPESEDDFATLNQYQFTIISTGAYIPKVLFKYWAGYDEKEDIYYHHFDYLKKNNLVYSIKDFKLDKGQMLYKDGFYDWNTKNNVFSSYQYIEDAYNFPLKEKNIPIHLEVADFLELQNKLNLMKNDYDYDNLEMIRALYNKVNELTTIIKSTPAVNGSPLNPTIVLINNTLLEDLNSSANEASQEVDLSEETIDNIIKSIKGK